MVQCTLDGSQPEAKAVQSFRWVPVAELDDLDWVPADLASMRRLIQDLIKTFSNYHHRLSARRQSHQP